MRVGVHGVPAQMLGDQALAVRRVRALGADQVLHRAVGDPAHRRLQGEPARGPRARAESRRRLLDPSLRRDEETDREARGDTFGETVDDIRALGRVRGEGVEGALVEEGPDAVLDEWEVQRPCRGRQLVPSRFPHRHRRRVVQGRLDVHGGQRCRTVCGRDRLRAEPLRVHGQRDQRDAKTVRDLLDQGIRQGLDADAAPGPYEGGERGGDGLTGVAREGQPGRGRAPARGGEEPGGGLAGGGRAGGGRGAQGLREDVGAQQRGQGGGEELRLAGRGGVVELQVDRCGGRRFGERAARGERRGPHEGAAPDLADDQSAPYQFAVHPPGRRPRDAAPPREHPLRGQPFTGPEPPGGDVLGDPVGYPPVVLHHVDPPVRRPEQDCTESKDLIAPRSWASLGSWPWHPSSHTRTKGAPVRRRFPLS